MAEECALYMARGVSSGASIEPGHHEQAECQLMERRSAREDRDVFYGKSRLNSDLEVTRRRRDGNFEACWLLPQC